MTDCRWVPALVLAVTVGQPETTVRPYYVVRVDQVATTRHRHVEVHAVVTRVTCERDGDWHLRLSSGGRAFVVAEVIPRLPVTPDLAPGTDCQDQPTPLVLVNSCAIVRGIAGVDPKHRWGEIHPVEELRVVPCP